MVNMGYNINKMNSKNKKLIAVFLIILILMPTVLLSVPKQAQADGLPVFDKIGAFIKSLILGKEVVVATATTATAAQTTGINAIKIKEWSAELVRQVLMGVARKLLAQMTQSTVNWINTGFHGQPLFLERPGSFFKDIAKSEIKNLVSTIGYDSARFPFGKDAAINTIEGFKSTFEQNAQYSLSKVTNDPVLLNNFRNNFDVGGWDGFILKTRPQNNPIGFNMMYGDYLARQLQGTDSNQASIIKDTLAQGQGFLSPQTCPDNPEYNNLKNEFQKPTSFKFEPQPGNTTQEYCATTFPEYVEYTECSLYGSGTFNSSLCLSESRGYRQNPELGTCLAKANTEYNAAKTAWEKKNTCPSGLVSTTPGSVVGNQIMKALVGPYETTGLAAAMGNSLSAIFDALLNKFMSSGLNALGGNKNQADTSDDFDYLGNTLGSPSDGGTVFGGPDEEIVLGTFKKTLQNAIENANQELKLIDNITLSSAPNDSATSSSGIFQIFAEIWPKVEELDMCLPGPNIGWQDRVQTEIEKNSQGLQIKMSDEDPAKVTAAKAADDGLKSAISSFKDWVSNKINLELPSSRNYLNAVNSIKTIYGQMDELSARKNVILETLIKLQSIQADLDVMPTQPVVGSEKEKILIRLKQRIDGMIVDVSNTTTVNDMKNALADAKDKLASLDGLITKCIAERIAKGWAVPGGEGSEFNNGVPSFANNSKTEQQLFCSLPIVGGYSHGPFKNTEGVSYPEIPLVNAKNVYPDSSGVSDTPHIDIAISCDVVSKTSATDYKKNLPGTIFPIR